MLSKYESRIMDAVYRLCDGTDGCLISAAEITSVLPDGKKFTRDGVDKALLNLHADGYFDLISSSRAGERMYVITLKDRGMNVRREIKQRRLDVVYKICLAFIGAFATFIFGVILKAIAGG